MQTTFELLHAAQDLIRDPANWIQGRSAVDALGVTCSITRATCFCSLGALHRADHDARPSTSEAYYEALEILDELSDGSIVEFNDNKTHAEVMALWDRAKERASVKSSLSAA